MSGRKVKSETNNRLQRFLELYPKKSTRGVYRAGIYNFIDCLYGEVRKGKAATKEEIDEYERLAERYFTEERDYFDDLLKFAAYMNDTPPIGAKAKIAGVLEFLRYNEIELTQKQRKQLSTKMPKGKTSRTAEKDVDIEILKKILAHMDIKGKAMSLILLSSGMRIGELMKIQLFDIDLTSTPPTIVVRGEYTKSGDTRTVFISSEAQEALDEWLKIREQYIRSARNKANGIVKNRVKPIQDSRLFPFTAENFRTQWENALKKTGLWTKDNSTGRSQIRVHGLRKFFRSQLALSCPLEIVEALMGHEGYLTEAYRRYSTKQMGEYYLKSEHHIMIMGSGDIREFQDRLQDTQAAVKGYKDIITEQAEEMVEIRRKMEERNGEIRRKMEERNGEIRRKMEERNGEIAKLREEIETMKRDGHYHQLAYDFLKLLSRDPTAATRFSEFIDHEKMREKD
jgi:integrase